MNFEQLLENLLGDDEWIAIDAAKALGEYGDRRAVSALLKTLDYDDRQAAFDQYIETALQSSQDLRGLIAVVEHRGGDITALRMQSAYALGKLGDSAAVPKLIEVVKHDKDIWVRKAAMWALGELKSPEAVPVLAEFLKTDYAFMGIGTKHLYDDVLDDLRKIGTPEALQVIEAWHVT